jgi:catechol 2,3-dioxygenase-like lactoylglutathione lyase family enzyme
MLHDSQGFPGFSVVSLAEAREFYGMVLGLECSEDAMGLTLKLANGTEVFVYEKPDHVPAVFTILNFPVDDIDAVVDHLQTEGVTLERYDLGEAKQDDKGILRGKAAHMGPDIAWLKDPSGNTLSVLSK